MLKVLWDFSGVKELSSLLHDTGPPKSGAPIAAVALKPAPLFFVVYFYLLCQHFFLVSVAYSIIFVLVFRMGCWGIVRASKKGIFPGVPVEWVWIVSLNTQKFELHFFYM